MKKNISEKISENFIIYKLLKKLNFNKLESFKFENDAAYLNTSKNYKTIVTTDTIIENIDFFKNDPPESIAQKLVCANLSDLINLNIKELIGSCLNQSFWGDCIVNFFAFLVFGAIILLNVSLTIDFDLP